MTIRHWSALGDVYVAPPPAPSHRAFGFTVGGVLAVGAALTGWRGHAIRAEVLGAMAAALVVAALVRPAALRGLAAVWSRIGHALGWVNSRILLTGMFVIILWPIGMVGRLCGSDPLDARRRGGSFWRAYSGRVRDPKHYERMY